jgi:hypothetical protein
VQTFEALSVVVAGLGSIYGHELHDGAMSKAEEQQIAEGKLWPHFEKVL